MRNIRITPYGDIGNRLFQYMFALAIKKCSGVPVAIAGLDMPAFNIQSADIEDEGFCVEIKNHTPPPVVYN